MNSAEFTIALEARTRVRGISIPPELAIQLFQYVDLLRRWNQTINLTALPLDSPTDEMLDRLLIEPLVVAQRLTSEPLVWFDLGSGGGSPALPIKLARPTFRLTMVESRERKAAFLRETVRVLELVGTTVENVRFETLRDRTELGGLVRLITLRAVRVDDEVLGVCSKLLAADGILVPFGFAGGALPGFDRDDRTGFFRRVPRGT